MKRLKILLSLLIITTLTYSQSLDGVKVCIDPGHGGHDASNDRHIVIPDFWESEGNYSKALHLEEILKSLGATVIVTRKGNSDSDDLALSVRAGIANSNNVDLFHSIHSNGYTGGSNYSLTLFRGTDSNPTFASAKTYAIKVYQEFEKTNHVVNRSSDNARGITSFYGSDYLGVIRPLTMPGILSEGSFHDYIPEGWRLKNEQYLRHEAWAITRSMLSYFSGGTLQNGNVAGILRDPFTSVPSTYKPIAELADAKKPLNNVTATLQPGNLVYNGDDQNNGYFFFDDVTPGNYMLYLTAENYSVDSASVTVSANKSVFVYKSLTQIPNENNPNITASLPEENSTGVSNATNIEITFDISMDKNSAESAFSISPTLTGTFSWKDNQKILVFNPNYNLTAGETYTVTMNNSAKTIFDKNLVSSFSYTFTTRSKLNLISAYPVDGDTEISPTVQVVLKFDNAIQASTLAGNISFEDESGTFVNLSVDQSAYAKGFITFVPSKELQRGASYTIILGENIGDVEGVKYQENIEIKFTVERDTYIEGNLVDDFETTGNWDSPTDNSSSVSLDASSNFVLSNSKKYAGSYSGKNNYAFTNSDGYFKISRVNPVAVGNGETEFGLWIWGDISNNIIEYWFLDASSNLHSIEVDTLNYTGWKIKSVKLSDVASGDLKFEGFGIKHNSLADTNGIVFIDNAQFDFSTSVKSFESELPTEYSLYQNFPNPFNPSTIIKYQIPSNGKSEVANTKLIVFDILGREVAMLVNKNQKPGNYEVKFDASQLTSGIYFYKLQSGSFVESKKMLLLK